VDVLPSDHAASDAFAVGTATTVGAGPAPTDSLAGAALDPAELLDVDVHEFARP
jgi:hypothetical protein